MTAYYNEIDPYVAQWLRNLIKAGRIAPGEVDERSIEDVRPDELTGYTQCHFFAGVGVWSYALRQAGWQDDRPVWTGSCPCQPFSQTGKRAGIVDERHLWPAFHWLIQQRGPRVIFGEQVASKDGLAWLDIVQTDLENTGYACGATDLCAAGVGAPHIRQRLWFVAERLGDTIDPGLERHAGNENDQTGREEQDRPATKAGNASGMADADSRQCDRRSETTRGDNNGRQDAGRTKSNSGIAGGRRVRGMADTKGERRNGSENPTKQTGRHSTQNGSQDNNPGPTNGFWRDADWLGCRDGKWRPVESGTFPLAHGITSRVGKLRAYGNAINAEAATEVIKAYIGK